MMFPEAAAVLARKGAEIILHPTAGYGWYDAIGEATLRTRANDNSLYILTAKNYAYNCAGKSSVIDPWGHVLADAGFRRNAVITREIDLDEGKTQPEWFYPSQMSGFSDVRERNRFERRPSLYGALVEPADRFRVPDEARRTVLRERIKKGECRW
jgi:predicted amidohydrolase